MTSDGRTDELPPTPAQDVGTPRVVDLREPPPPARTLLGEAYEERLHLFDRSAGEAELEASALRILDLEAALRPTRRLPRNPLEPATFLG